MGESRQELLAWMNNLLALNITKVEQCGTGAALCQIFDSIFLDLPMSKVKFTVNTEYAYLQNFKVLQNCFTKHQVNRPIPVESLIKCKMQDNLEFLQWTKKYWDQYFPGIEYDPLARRKGAGAPAASSGGAPVSASSLRSSTSGMAPRRQVPSNSAATRAPRTGSAAGGGHGPSSAAHQALLQENTSLKESVAELDKAQDFYFNKLRQIELMLQQEVELRPELEQEEGGLVPRMQAILYSTEEGFEIPDDDGTGAIMGPDTAEEETF